MSENLESLGAARLMGQLNARQPVMDVFREFQKDLNGPNAALFTGAVGKALTMLSVAQGNGAGLGSPEKLVDVIIKCPGYVLCIEMNRALANNDFNVIFQLLRAVAGALDAIALHHPEMLRQPVAKTAPLDVRVVGLPERRTETEIERDAVGDIVSTVQVERDVV